ncbi:PIN domain-containing protein [Deinococcus sp.]|uniref:PIN domain-containing protein n=1 Tax=Deinococcus sp. TaxID=47478 RepID=UPI003C7CE686
MLALDTNVLIAFQKRDALVRASYAQAVSAGEQIAVPSLVRYEARKELQNPIYERRLRFLDTLLDLHPTLELDERVVDTAVVLSETLRRNGNVIADADILIAATALKFSATLVTNNTKHFKRIPGLNLIDWQEEPQ